jgi:hypothetical protein
MSPRVALADSPTRAVLVRLWGLISALKALVKNLIQESAIILVVVMRQTHRLPGYGADVGVVLV